MKIIAKATGSAFIVEISEQELANIAGHDYATTVPNGTISVGKEIKVAELWRALAISRGRHDELAKMATQLRTQATRIESINAALANPIVEVKA